MSEGVTPKYWVLALKIDPETKQVLEKDQQGPFEWEKADAIANGLADNGWWVQCALSNYDKVFEI